MMSQVITDDRMSMVSVESQKDYHARRKHHHYTRTTTTTVSSTTKSPVSTTTVTVVEQVEDNKIPEVTRWTTTEPTETWEITTISSTTISTTPSTTTTTTTPPRKYQSSCNNTVSPGSKLCPLSKLQTIAFVNPRKENSTVTNYIRIPQRINWYHWIV